MRQTNYQEVGYDKFQPGADLSEEFFKKKLKIQSLSLLTALC
jgi:hypothetical protein